MVPLQLGEALLKTIAIFLNLIDRSIRSRWIRNIFSAASAIIPEATDIMFPAALIQATVLAVELNF